MRYAFKWVPKHLNNHSYFLPVTHTSILNSYYISDLNKVQKNAEKQPYTYT